MKAWEMSVAAKHLLTVVNSACVYDSPQALDGRLWSKLFSGPTTPYCLPAEAQTGPL